MKKLFIIAIALMAFGCGGQQRRNFKDVKMGSYKDTYESFIRAVEEKDIAALDYLSIVDFPDFDVIATYTKPKASIVPKQPDGAFGIFDKGTHRLYYLFIADNDVLREVRVLMLEPYSGKFKICNYGPIEMSDLVISLYSANNPSSYEEEVARMYRETNQKATQERHPKASTRSYSTDEIKALIRFYLDDNLNDPKSYQSVEWGTLSTEGNVYKIRHKYRAKNAFGGYVLENKIFILDFDSDTIKHVPAQ